MKNITSSGHEIIFEDQSFKSLNKFLREKSFHAYVILVDENTLSACLPTLITKVPVLSKASIIEVESGEQSKAVEIAANIWRTLSDLKADRSTLFINLGGGVITDLGGFSASLFKRGIPFIHVPTSLLAMADASAGGKTAIDLDHVKNAVGNFAQPEGVFISFGFLDTLPPQHLTNGLAEVYKMALIRDKSMWNKITGISREELIYRSIKHKIQIVKKDPFDKGLRKILNFGHTLGHAIEGLSLAKGKPVLHGEAVIAGMIMESHISAAKRKLSKKEYHEIAATLARQFPLISIEGISPEEIKTGLANDKKNTGGTGNFSLLTGIGSCVWDQQVSWTLCENAIADYKRLCHG